MATKKISQLTELLATALETGGMVEVAMGGENYQLDLKSLFGDYSFNDNQLVISNGNVIEVSETVSLLGVTAKSTVIQGTEVEIDLSIANIESGTNYSAVTKEWVLAKLAEL